MKQLLQFKTFLLAAIIGMFAGTALAQTIVEFDFKQSADAYGSGVTPMGNVDLTAGETTFTNGDVYIKYETKGGSTNLRWWNDGIRAYNANEFSVNCTDGEIESIAFEGTITVVETTSTGGSVSSKTWTAPASGGVTSVTFKGNHTSKNKTITKVTVTLASSSEPGDTRTATTTTFPSTSYSVELGDGFAAPTATVSDAAGAAISGAEVTYASNNEAVATVDATTGVVTINAAGTATITATFEGDSSYKGSTGSYTLTVATIQNISDITAAGTYTVRGTIVAKSTRGFIVGDGTGYVYYYNTGYSQSSYNIGDMVQLSGSVVVYGSVYEFDSSTTITAASSSNYVEEEPTVLSGADMDSRVGSATPAQLSNYVQYEGTLSVSGTYYNITGIDGASTAKGSISYPISTDFASLNGKKVVVKGYYVGISSSQYYNTMIGSIEEPADDPSDTRTSLTFTFPEDSYAIEAGAEAAAFVAPTLSITDDAGASVALNEGDVVYLLAENNGEGSLSVDPATGAVEIGSDYAGTFKVTAGFMGNETYKEASASYTVVVSQVLDFAGVRALADNESGIVKFTDAKVLAISGTNYIWVRDASAALLLFKSGLSVTAGQVINGKATVTKTTYMNQIETTGAIDDSELIITDGEDAVPVEIATAEASDYDSDLVKFSGVIVTGGVIEGDNNVTIYDGRFNLGYTFAEGTQYDIVGILGQYDTTVQIYPISVEEVADDTPAAPVISVPSGEVEAGTVVTVSYSDANATLIITTDGSNPADMEEGATVYDFDTNADLVADGTLTVSVTINEPTTIHAIVMNNVTEAVSDEATATYTIALPALDAPTFQPMNDISQYTIKGNNIYIGDEGQLQVYIIGSTTYDTYYTLDGSDPTTSETRKTITASTMNMRINMFHMAGFTVNVADGQTLKAVTYDATNSRYSEVADWGYIVHTGNPVVAAGTYAKVTSNADIEDGKNYILVFEDEDKAQVFTGELSTTSTKYGLNVEAEYSDENEINISELGVTPVVINALTEGFAIKVGDNYVSWTSGNSLALSGDEYAWNIDVEATDAKSSITSVDTPARFLQYNSSSPRFACYTGSQKYVAIYKEVPATETFENLTIDITSAGYSTLFYSDKDIELPVNGEGITVRAYTITFDGKKISEGDEYVSGDRIPANTAVVLEEYNHEAVSFVAKAYAPSAAAASESQIENYLYGFDVETDLESEFGAEGYKYYKLSGSPSGVVGFYWAKADGAPFVSAAHKAVLILPADAAAGVRGFGLSDGNATAIQSVEVNAAANGKVYDLQGRRVQNAGKGVFIINGKKVIK